jgi:inner membrane protein
MDNMTHSLFGISVAETYLQTRKDKPARLWRPLFYFTSILANNFPDFDLLFRFVDPTRLGYLVNHRGFTHTLILTPLMALFIFGLSILVADYLKLPWREGKKDLFLLSFLGGLTHIALDSLNSYGVHPFWPLDSHWYYLDSVFIIEPLLWVGVICMLWNVLERKKIAYALGALTVLIYGFGGLKGLISPVALTTFIFLTVLIFGLFKKISHSRLGLSSLIAFCIVCALFYSHQLSARHLVVQSLKQQTSNHLIDVSLTPLPSNLNCWFFLAASKSETTYQVDAGVIALYNRDPASCQKDFLQNGLDLQTTKMASSNNLLFLKTYAAPLIDIALSPSAPCQLQSWYKFARFPHKDGMVYNDLRFAVKNKINFSTFDVSTTSPECSPVPAPWIPARSDL